MQKIKIITDTGSDIDLEIAKKYNVELLPIKLVVGDKEYREGYDFSKDEFYKILSEYDGIPTHSQVIPFEWLQAIEKSVNEGYTQIILFPINQNGSSTFKSALDARIQYFNENEDSEVKIYVINTLTYSGGYGYAVIKCAQMVQENKGISEILEFCDKWFSSYELYFVAMDLKYAKKSGRIGTAAAIAGELLGIKPVICLTGGNSVTFSKARSVQKAVDTIIETAKERIKDNEAVVVYYGSNKDEANSFRKSLKEQIKAEELYDAMIGACISSNAGPEVLGIGYMGEKRNEQIIF